MFDEPKFVGPSVTSLESRIGFVVEMRAGLDGVVSVRKIFERSIRVLYSAESQLVAVRLLEKSRSASASNC
jgi:hypothetical protein